MRSVAITSPESGFPCGVPTRVAIFGLLAAALLVMPDRAALANEPEAASPAATVAPNRAAEIADWIKQLAAPSYVEREQASQALAEYGIAAQPALMDALKSDDEEVRFRARTLLLEVLDADLDSRISRFENQIGDGNVEKGHDPQLPGWDAYRELAGDTPEARRLFLEMIREEPILLEAIEQGPEAALAALRIRCDAIQQQMEQPQAFGNVYVAAPRVELGAVAAFFLASADDKVVVDENVGRLVQMAMYQSNFQNEINQGPRSEPLRRLLGRWIISNRSTTMAYQGLAFAVQYNLKEGHELSRHVIQTGGQPANLLQTALLVLGRFGNENDIELIEPLLNDRTPIQQFGIEQSFQQEVRDVALAVAVHLSGQNPRDYGYHHLQPNPQMLYNPASLTFTSPETRDAAFKKWQAWRAKKRG